MPFRFLRCAEDGAVLRVTLARPPLNILTIDMMEELNAALEAAVARPRLKVVLLAAEGKAFSAGVAIEDHQGDRVKPMLESFHRIFRQLQSLDCVTVASVQGAALGGGAELATFCDVVIAADTATLGQPEIKVGVFPPIAALHYPVRVGPHRALRLLLTGEVIGAAEAERIGLVNRVVPEHRLKEAEEALLGKLLDLSSVAIRASKMAMAVSFNELFERALDEIEAIYLNELVPTEDGREGLQAFLEKRAPVWRER